MGKRDQRIGANYRRADKHLLEVLQVHLDGHLVAPVDAVGNDKGSADNRVGKAVENGRIQVVHRIAA